MYSLHHLRVDKGEVQYETTSKSPILVLDNVGACGRERERYREGREGGILAYASIGVDTVGTCRKG